MIAVTGANGLLGSFIVKKLLANNEPFVAIKRKNSDVSLLADVHQPIEWREGDVLDPVSLAEALTGVTTVIHTAAMVSFNPHASGKIFDTNVRGTQHVVNACLTHHVSRLIYISSIAALGRVKDQHTVDETAKWSESPMNSTYAKSKYLAELEIYRAQEEGIHTSILNPSLILAPADWHKSSSQLFKYVWDEKLFYIDNEISYVDVRDVAEATYRLVHANFSGERFIVNAGVLSLSEFFQKIATRFHKKAPSIKLNSALLHTLAFLEDIRGWITRSEPLISKETARLAQSRFQYSNEKIKKYLGLEFQTIDQTLNWCCEYYMKRQNGKK